MKLVTIVLLIITSFAAAQADLKDQIVAKEREELTALKSADYKTFADLIADDAVFLDPRGTGTKAEVVEHVSDFKLLDFTMDDIHFIPLSATSGIVAYKLTQKGSSHGHEFTATVYASATWVQRGDKWVCIFSQETPARKQQ
jgi:ketosteroid isomerase-like protein